MKRNIFCIAILLVCASGSVTLAVAPIDQPASNLREGWLSLGADYSNTTIDLQIKNVDTGSLFTEGTAKDVKIDLILGKAGYGITNNWEVFAGFGAAKADLNYEGTEPHGDSGLIDTNKYDISGDTGFAAQIGTKYTLFEKALIRAGATLQLTWLSLPGTITKEQSTDSIFLNSGEGDIDTDLFVLQAAPGLSYQVSYGISIYGGPLFQWIFGTSDATGKTGLISKVSDHADIREDSVIGGWVGIHADIDAFTTVNVEYQMTGSSGTIGLGLMSKF